MTYTVSVTSQGQISIPAQIRRELNLGKTSTVLVSVRENEIIVKPVKDFLDLAGSLKTNKKPLSNAELDNVVAQAVADEYKEKLKRMK